MINFVASNIVFSYGTMTEIPTPPSATKSFRVTLFAFACLLSSLATWILIADLLRPAVVEFPSNAQSTPLTNTHRNKATTAARIGLIRGDLWTQAALAYGDVVWSENGHSSDTDTSRNERIRILTERAISYAPHDSRLWLILAAIDLRFDWLNESASTALRMSYYTGSNTIKLVPARLLLSVQSRALADSDFQDLVRHDIRISVAPKSELLPALIDAYANAPQFGQEFIERTLAEFDPSILPAVHSRQQKH